MSKHFIQELLIVNKMIASIFIVSGQSLLRSCSHSVRILLHGVTKKESWLVLQSTHCQSPLKSTARPRPQTLSCRVYYYHYTTKLPHIVRPKGTRDPSSISRLDSHDRQS